jgi:hypothetical protein
MVGKKPEILTQRSRNEITHAFRVIQEELERIFNSDDGNQIPVVEILPGGINFIHGDNIVLDGAMDTNDLVETLAKFTGEK